MDGHGIIAWIIIGIIAGWLTGKLMKGSGYGVIMDMIIGLIGALIGGFISSRLRHRRGVLLGRQQVRQSAVELDVVDLAVQRCGLRDGDGAVQRAGGQFRVRRQDRCGELAGTILSSVASGKLNGTLLVNSMLKCCWQL